MSSPANLMQELCPDGVDFRTLGEVGTIYGGLTGKTKADFVTDGNARFVSYIAVFQNLTVGAAVDDRVMLSFGERQNSIRHGDVLFTASSESANDVGMSSAVTVEPTEPVYLNSFCFGFRPNDAGALHPEFSKHLFRSSSVRTQIVRTANGVTRFNVSKERFRAVKIPVPPPRVQLEIVRMLDSFTGLVAQCEAELEARRQQYAYYRDTLLTFAQGEARWAALGDLGTLVRGKRFTKRDMVPVGTGVPSIHYGEIYTHFGTSADAVISNVREDMAPSLRFAVPGDVVIAEVGETVEDVGKAVAWLGQTPIAITDHSYAFRSDLDPAYVSYVLQTPAFQRQKSKAVARTKVKTLLIDGLSRLTIPVPPLSEQKRLVEVLDKFDALVNDMSIGLPAEIVARRRQYEYYRDRLLTFEQVTA